MNELSVARIAHGTIFLVLKNLQLVVLCAKDVLLLVNKL